MNKTVKISITDDSQTYNINYILRKLEEFVSNQKTKFDIAYNPNGIKFSKITGFLDIENFVIRGIQKKGSLKYKIRCGGLETEIEESFLRDGSVLDWFNRIINVLHNKIQTEYVLDEKTKKYIKKPNVFEMVQSVIRHIRG